MAKLAEDSTPSKGFPPVAGFDARILILGSLPGDRSIAEQQYYAHPKNAFWPIMRELFGIQGDYQDRLQQLIDKRIALWDVLRSSLRSGSLDASIKLESACVNDFGTLVASHSNIRLIAFNGKKAEQLFKKFGGSAAMNREILQVGLPSTSPAYAAMPFSGKLALWRQAIVPAAEQSI